MRKVVGPSAVKYELQRFDHGHTTSLPRTEDLPGERIHLFGNVIGTPTGEADEPVWGAAGVLPRCMNTAQRFHELILRQRREHLFGECLAKPFMTTIETHWWRPAPYYEVPWRGKWATELGGGFLGHAIHAHDMLNYVHGAATSVFAFDATLVNPIEVEDNVAAAVRMQNGSLATLSMTLGSRQEISRLRFCFENLVAESILEPYTMSRDPWTFVSNDETLQKRIDDALATVKTTEDGYTRQFELFHEAVATGGEPPVTLTDARRSLELVTAAYHSARTGRPAGLPILPDHPLYRSWLPETARKAN